MIWIRVKYQHALHIFGPSTLDEKGSYDFLTVSMSVGKRVFSKMACTVFLKKCFVINLQGSTYLFKVLSWKFILSQPYVGRVKMKTYTVAQQIFPAHRRIYFAKLLKKNHCLKPPFLRPMWHLFVRIQLY